jgi:hypothetical protein
MPVLLRARTTAGVAPIVWLAAAPVRGFLWTEKEFPARSIRDFIVLRETFYSVLL